MILTWRDLPAAEREELWEELEEWVWRRRSAYPVIREAIPDCWPAHEDLVTELTAFMVWWQDVYEPLSEEAPKPSNEGKPDATSEEATGRSAVTWHESLEKAAPRWAASGGKCRIGECVVTGQRKELADDWRNRRQCALDVIRHQLDDEDRTPTDAGGEA